MIDTTPTPIEIKDAKPSDILKSMPRDRWMAKTLTDGEGHYCALGWLGMAGECATDSELKLAWTGTYEGIWETWGLTKGQGQQIYVLNDRRGLDAVIAYLEGIGK